MKYFLHYAKESSPLVGKIDFIDNFVGSLVDTPQEVEEMNCSNPGTEGCPTALQNSIIEPVPSEGGHTKLEPEVVEPGESEAETENPCEGGSTIDNGEWVYTDLRLQIKIWFKIIISQMTQINQARKSVN